MIIVIRDTLQSIKELLEKHNVNISQLNLAMSGNEKELWDFLISNDLWGGSGSIADQGLIDKPTDRKLLEKLLIELGNDQMLQGKVNPRTKMWVTTFEKWNVP